MRLTVYIVRRLIILVPTLIGVTLITFTLTHVGPPTAALTPYCNIKAGPCTLDNPKLAAIVDYLHLRDPIPVQYVFYLRALLQGNWGFTTTSGSQGEPVTQAIAHLFPATVELAVGSTIIAVLLGIPTGTLSAVRKDKVADHFTRIVALSAYSIPYFWLALLLQIIAGLYVPGWPINGMYTTQMLDPQTSPWAFTTPAGGGTPVQFSNPTHFFILDAAINGSWPFFVDSLEHIVLPALTLGFGIFGVILRMVRSGMVDAMNQDYVRTAWAKGIPEDVVIHRHIRRNALLPATTVIGLIFAGLLGGVVLVEYIFQWPGIGNWAAQSVLQYDVGGVLGTTLLFALFLTLTNLVVDVIYAYLDPRISL